MRMTCTTNNIICPICKRSIPPAHQEEHHLIPHSLARRNKYAKIENKKETVTVCSNCGDQIHKLFSEKDLADKYNTIEKLLATPEIQKWVQWIFHRWNNFGICMMHKKRR